MRLGPVQDERVEMNARMGLGPGQHERRDGIWVGTARCVLTMLLDLDVRDTAEWEHIGNCLARVPTALRSRSPSPPPRSLDGARSATFAKGQSGTWTASRREPDDGPNARARREGRRRAHREGPTRGPVERARRQPLSSSVATAAA